MSEQLKPAEPLSDETLVAICQLVRQLRDANAILVRNQVPDGTFHFSEAFGLGLLDNIDSLLREVERLRPFEAMYKSGVPVISQEGYDIFVGGLEKGAKTSRAESQ